ncbi:MAG: hypothetical protein F6K17_38395, partial [Okeania sp. SIO3C4]|nr:hypothetical protein [Okeania sp. SIO3C4]
SIAMAYAIWEGFIQTAFSNYLEELSKKGKHILEFKEQFLVFDIENRFKQLFEYPKNSSKKAEFFGKLKEYFDKESHELYSPIDTESNVGFDVLNKIMLSFCLDKFPEHWKTYRGPEPSLKVMLKRFLDYRNAIAHGQDITSQEKVTQQVYAKFRGLVLDLMYEIQDRMLKALEEESYLK